MPHARAKIQRQRSACGCGVLTQSEILKCSNLCRRSPIVRPACPAVSCTTPSNCKGKGQECGGASPAQDPSSVRRSAYPPSPSSAFLYVCPFVDCKCADLACSMPCLLRILMRACLAIIRPSSDRHQTVIKPSSDRHQIIRILMRACLAIDEPSPSSSRRPA